MPDPTPAARPLILASSSPYRRELLQRFGLPFESISPAIDESVLPDEPAEALSLRLARDKALAVARQHPQAIIIGSDQVLVCEDRLLGKPGTYDNAVRQLQFLSGRSMVFYTAVCVIPGNDAAACEAVTTTEVHFRELTLTEIHNYLAREPAFDCAGSCKAEGLGISLCESISSEDPTAIIGLPLIALRRLLQKVGYAVP